MSFSSAGRERPTSSGVAAGHGVSMSKRGVGAAGSTGGVGGRAGATTRSFATATRGGAGGGAAHAAIVPAIVPIVSDSARPRRSMPEAYSALGLRDRERAGAARAGPAAGHR